MKYVQYENYADPHHEGKEGGGGEFAKNIIVLRIFADTLLQSEPIDQEAVEKLFDKAMEQGRRSTCSVSDPDSRVFRIRNPDSGGLKKRFKMLNYQNTGTYFYFLTHYIFQLTCFEGKILNDKLILY